MSDRADRVYELRFGRVNMHGGPKTGPLAHPDDPNHQNTGKGEPKSDSSATAKKYAGLKNEDFQNRDGGRPKAGIPVEIQSGSHKGEHFGIFVFKDTNQSRAKSWVEKYLKQKGIPFDKLIVRQGDDSEYKDDWVDVEAIWNEK